MHATIFDSLTPSERAILRELLRQRDQKCVARELGLSPETVKTHLRNAREKCGADTSFALAKAFALHEGAPPRWGIPLDGGGRSVGSDASEAMPADGDADGDRNEVREARTSFAFDRDRTLPPTAQATREETNRDGLRRMLAILGIVILLIVVIILAFPLSESFQRLANEIEPPTG